MAMGWVYERGEKIGIVLINAEIDDVGNKHVIEGKVVEAGLLGVSLDAHFLGGIGFIPWSAIAYVEPLGE
jgi:hypothetical protein